MIARGRAVKLAVAYAGIATLWILTSDSLLAALGLPAHRIAAYSLLKGIGFVLVTSIALFALVDRFTVRSEEREREYRELFERNPNPMWVYDLETLAFLAVNDAAVAKYGYTRTEFLGMTIADIRPAEDHTRLLENVEAVRASAGDEADLAGLWRHVDKQGRVLWVDILSHVTEFDGRRAELVLARDVTEAVEAREALLAYQRDLERIVAERTADLERANARLQSATDAKTTFLATMSHEVRTPLHSIIGFASLLADGVTGPLTDEQRVQVGIVRDAGKHLLDLINDILDLSRIEAGREEVRLAEEEVGLIADSVGRTIAPLAESRGLAWSLEVTAPVDSRITTDRRRLEQVLTNLLGNAVKYTPEGSVALRVTAHGDEYRFAVADTGTGIEPELQESVFNEFVRLPSAVSASIEGTGLGLPIAVRLAELLGGRIELESVPGQGSVFTVIVPRSVASDRPGAV